MASKAGRLQIQLEMQVAQLQRDLNRATREIDSASANWKKSFTSVFSGTLAADFVQRLGGAMAQTITDLGDIADKSAALGDTAEMFQKIAHAAELSGVSMESVLSASAKLQKSLGEGSKQTAEALQKLGLSLEDVRKMSTGEAFITVAGRLGEVKNASLQAALAADTMGKGFAAVKPFAAQGEQAMRDVVAAARAVSDEAVKAGDDFGDSLADMQGAVRIFIAEALAPLLPLLTQSAKEFTNVGNNASGAAEGVDRATSSARQLGTTLADIFQSVGAFRDVLNSLQDSLVGMTQARFNPQAIFGAGGIKWPWQSDDSMKDPVKSLDELGKAWSRFTTHFNDVQSTVTTTGEFVTGARQVAESTDTVTETTKRSTAARKESNKEKEKELDLDRALAGVNQRVEEQWSRTEPLLTDLALAREEANGASRDELELLQLRLQGYNEEQIAIVEKTQAIRNATAESAENARQLAEEQAALTDTIAHGFEDIFFSMAEGADQTKEAVARLVTELAAMYLQMLAINTLKQFNAGGTWGFQGVAKGGVFDQRGMVPFAQGGIVRSATAFAFGGGRLGVMGEAGPEAIMPLGRDAQGRLGVRGGGINVNVHNFGGAQVDVQRNGQDVAILIDQVRGVIANDFARGGNKVTTALEGAYGVRR